MDNTGVFGGSSGLRCTKGSVRDSISPYKVILLVHTNLPTSVRKMMFTVGADRTSIFKKN
jgi:hypothetical protein